MESFILGLDPVLVYVVVGVLAFGESVSFLSLLLPGEVVLVGAAAVASIMGVDPVVLGAVAAVAAGAGGLCGYEIGRRYGRRLIAWTPLTRRIEAHLPSLTKRLDGPSGTTVVVTARFNQFTRALAPAIAGMTAMRWRRFAWANAVGAVLWGSIFTGIGVFAARWWHASSGMVQVILAVCLAVAAGAWFTLGRTATTTSPGNEPGLVSPRNRMSEEEETPKKGETRSVDC